jgi:single-strand DNA-binding protein
MTPGLNKIMVIGYLGRDPEMRYTPSGKSVANFSLAYHRQWKSPKGENQDETEWFNVVAWGKLAEFSKNSMKKGNLVYVEGRLQSRSWQDKDGNQHTSVEIVARDILLLHHHDNQAETVENEEDEEYPY